MSETTGTPLSEESLRQHNTKMSQAPTTSQQSDTGHGDHSTNGRARSQSMQMMEPSGFNMVGGGQQRPSLQTPMSMQSSSAPNHPSYGASPRVANATANQAVPPPTLPTLSLNAYSGQSTHGNDRGAADRRRGSNGFASLQAAPSIGGYNAYTPSAGIQGSGFTPNGGIHRTNIVADQDPLTVSISAAPSTSAPIIAAKGTIPFSSDRSTTNYKSDSATPPYEAPLPSLKLSSMGAESSKTSANARA